ncbi:MAG: FAD-dependent thymidylate synthase [Dongiaceae bacterium]
MPLSPEQQAEVDALSAAEQPTRRATVPALETILYKAIPVLDQGFVRVIDYMGDDDAIVQAARVSYGKGTRKTSEDRGLIHYLMRHRHSTPFEMCEIKFHVKLPIFVARQWIRHRTANVNEYSARYSILDREFYVPDRDFLEFERKKRQASRRGRQAEPELFEQYETITPKVLAAQSQKNRQGRDQILPLDQAREVLAVIKAESARAYTIYTKLLNEDAQGQVIDTDRVGIARELARMVLPANVYTQWYWKVDLHNLLHFLGLRADPHAQHEIRVYAEAMLDVVKRWVPITHEAFRQHRLNAVTLSAEAFAVVKRMLAGEKVSQAASGLGKREWRELMAALGRSE